MSTVTVPDSTGCSWQCPSQPSASSRSLSCPSQRRKILIDSIRIRIENVRKISVTTTYYNNNNYKKVAVAWSPMCYRVTEEHAGHLVGQVGR